MTEYTEKEIKDYLEDNNSTKYDQVLWTLQRQY